MWVATLGGLARLVDDLSASSQATKLEGRRPAFVVQPIGDLQASSPVEAVVAASDGTLWCMARDGVYRANDANGQTTLVRIAARDPEADATMLFADSQGRVWVGVGSQLHVVDAAGQMTLASSGDVFTSPIAGLAEVTPGRILAATRRRLLASTTEGIGGTYSSVLQDRDHNLWITTLGVGAYALPPEKVVRYDLPGGIPDSVIGTVFGSANGRLYVSSVNSGLMEVRPDGLQPVAGSAVTPFADLGNRVLCDRHGDCWAWSTTGLYLLPGPDLQFRRTQLLKDIRPVLGPGYGPSLYEDPDGVIWVATAGPTIYRIDRAPGGVPHVRRIALDPALEATIARMVSDRSGGLWLSNYGALARLVNGKTVRLEATEGLPETLGRALFVDSRGWLWIGLRYGGVSMTSNPDAEHPRFTNYSTREGLASYSVGAIAEDDFGRIYFGTGRGLDRLDTATGRIRHIATARELAGNPVTRCFKDLHGDMWIGTLAGLFRLTPRADPIESHAPPVHFGRFSVAGDDVVLPERGAMRLEALTFPSSAGSLTIEYAGFALEGGRRLRHQYKLEPADRDWSVPTDQRSISYARLGAGSYRFLVRAQNEEGAVSDQPATIEFRILPPIWLRWWFLSLSAAAVAGLAVAGHRARVRSLLAMERLRSQVALDLHDDVGAGLSQIAIMSEVAQDDRGKASTRQWAEVGDLARGLRESMSDIVWAVDPRADRFDDLIHRMKDVAFNLLEARGLHVDFVVEPAGAFDRIAMAPDRRRHLLLIVKEAIANVARHARASRVTITLRLEGSALHLSIHDDGCGFDPAAAGGGHGLSSLKRRARELQGTIAIESALVGARRFVRACRCTDTRTPGVHAGI